MVTLSSLRIAKSSFPGASPEDSEKYLATLRASVTRQSWPVSAQALQAIDGIGPFSAAMILLRGLGRMDDVPLDLPGISRVAQEVYGADWKPAHIRALYGTELGNWAFYLKAGGGGSLRAADPIARS